jgi:hypothetical protein
LPKTARQLEGQDRTQKIKKGKISMKIKTKVKAGGGTPDGTSKPGATNGDIHINS